MSWDMSPSESRNAAPPTRKRKSRWSDAPIHYTSSLSVLPKFLPAGLTPEQQECLAIRMRIEELTKKMSMNDLDMEWFREKEASPEPVYDNQGKRMNTREQRRKDSLAQERQLLVEISFTMNPYFKPPADYTSASIKRMKKMFIPVDKFPEYNFIGLIIGPRGNTQKRMEKETGCKILIRGRGSVKEGKSGMRNGKSFTDDEPLHVLISADNDVQLGKAAKMIAQLLVPVEDGENKHKAMQLIELAKINGTLRDQSWRHPDEAGESFTRPNIKCAICLETSHPTIDCPLKDQDGKIKLSGGVEEAMSSEYDKFLQEIGETKTDVYEEFMQSISGDVNKPADPGAAAPWAQTPMGMPPQGYPQGAYPPPLVPIQPRPNP